MPYLGTAAGAALGDAVAGDVRFGSLWWVGVPIALAALAMLQIRLRLGAVRR